jgi:molybdopterin biosynthesis enzyme
VSVECLSAARSVSSRDRETASLAADAGASTTRTRPLASPSDRHQFFTVRVVDGHVEPAFKSSGDITSMAGADGFIEIPSDSGEMPVGTPVTVTLFQSE